MYMPMAVKAITINIAQRGSGKSVLLMVTAPTNEDKMINPQSVSSMTASAPIMPPVKNTSS